MSPAEYEAAKAAAWRQAKSISDCLFFPVVVERELSRRVVAEHEAAHAVVAMSLGGACVFVTIEVPGAPTLSESAVGVVILPSTSAFATAAIAGNAWDLSAGIGLLDAKALLGAVDAEIGNLSHSRDVVVAYLKVWRLRATEVLIQSFDKVMTVADALERHGTLTEPELRRIARFPPLSDPGVANLLRYWKRSLRDGSTVHVPLSLIGVHELAKLAYKRKKAA